MLCIKCLSCQTVITMIRCQIENGGMVLGTNSQEWTHFLVKTMPLEMHRPVCFQPGPHDTTFSPKSSQPIKVQIFFYFFSEEAAESLQACIANTGIGTLYCGIRRKEKKSQQLSCVYQVSGF